MKAHAKFRLLQIKLPLRPPDRQYLHPGPFTIGEWLPANGEP